MSYYNTYSLEASDYDAAVRDQSRPPQGYYQQQGQPQVQSEDFYTQQFNYQSHSSYNNQSHSEYGNDYGEYVAAHENANSYTEQSQAYQSEQQQEGVWAQQISAIYDDINNSVQCLEYDSVYERLWIGHKNGRAAVSYVQGK